MAILISCIGGSDPIRSYYDGPVLNILKYKTDITKAYMFLTKKTNEIHEDKNKNYYRRAYERFCTDNNRKIEFNYVYFNIEKVNDFDAYYDVFGKTFEDIITNNPDELIYVNLTSGTAQMQTTLTLIVQKYASINLKSIQVNNFDFESKNKSNDAFSSEYDIESEIEYNTINEKEHDRNEFVQLNTIIKNNFIEQVKALIKIYDYRSVVESFKDILKRDSKLYAFILFAKYRQEMDYVKAADILDYENYNVKKYMPLYIKGVKSRKNEIFEYYLSIKNLIKTQQYNDLVIRLDLFTIEVLIEFLKKNYNTDVNKLRNGKYLSIEKIENHDPDLKEYIINKYEELYNMEYNDSYVNIPVLNIILGYYLKDNNPEIANFFNKINKLHSIRNDAAHTFSIISILDFKQIINPNEVIKMFEIILSEYIYTDIKKEYFKSYELVNKTILELI